jgi:hypothetical protein
MMSQLNHLFDTSHPLMEPVWVQSSQIEMSTWLLSPQLIMIFFILSGLTHYWVMNRRRRAYPQLQRNKRCKLSVPLVINTPITQEFSVRTFDISLSGAFLSYDDLKHSMSFTSLVGRRNGIKVGDLVDVSVFTGRFSQFTCQARVIRYNLEPGTMPPPGIAIEFVNMSKKNRRVLQNLIDRELLPKAS